MVHEDNIDHRGFIHDDQVVVESMVAIPLETTQTRLKLQQAMDGLRLAASRFAQPFGRATSRGAEGDAELLRRKDLDDAADECRFADAGATRDDEYLVRRRAADRVPLSRGQG